MTIVEKQISIFRPQILAIVHGRRYKVASSLYIMSIARYRCHKFGCTALFDCLIKILFQYGKLKFRTGHRNNDIILGGKFQLCMSRSFWDIRVTKFKKQRHFYDMDISLRRTMIWKRETSLPHLYRCRWILFKIWAFHIEIKNNLSKSAVQANLWHRYLGKNMI